MPNEIFTFGCRLNTYESEVIRDHLRESGQDNVAVFNTCAVTKEAERQAKQAIRKYARQHPEAKIIVTGCAAQISPAEYAGIAGVAQVVGNQEKLSAETYQKTDFISESERIKVNDIMAVKETANHLIQGLEDRARAFLQVQNGCNHRCTFCIIPYGRGNSRSVPIGEIVTQTKVLVAQGYNEIVLTGVDITSYGADLPGTPSLGQMMRRLLALVPELPRLRLSSLDVAEVDEDLRDLIATETRLMPHMHISLQAGDTMILKRMKRRHTREQAIAFCAWARAVRPDMVFGADIITGFPTETEVMFQRTLDIVEEAGLSYLHVFPYSEREGTPAASIPAEKQVPKAERKARAERLRAKGAAAEMTLYAGLVGTQQTILIEKIEDGVARGRTPHFAMVEVPLAGRDIRPGGLLQVQIERLENNLLQAV